MATSFDSLTFRIEAYQRSFLLFVFAKVVAQAHKLRSSASIEIGFVL